MGVFDYIRCEYPVVGMDIAMEFQTKDTDAQWLEEYKIDVEGYLWFHEKQREWVEDKNELLGGHLRVVSSKWVKCDTFRGDIEFGHFDTKTRQSWEYSALLDAGKVIDIKTIRNGDVI